MDNITHTMTGVILSRVGLHRIAPHATMTLVLAANAPDVDVITWAWGQLAYLRYHRGLTHSLIGIPVLAALVVLVVRLAARRGGKEFRWGRNYMVALIGVASHPVMDLANTYGIRPWLPFSGQWYSWDISFLVDLWVWILLFIALGVPAVGRLISSEIGDRAGSGRGPAVFVLLCLVGWWTARGVIHWRAVAMLDAHVYGFNPAAASDTDGSARSPKGVPPLRVAAFPTPANPLVWHGFVETENFYQLVDVDVRRPLDPTTGRIVYKPEASPVLEAALRTDTAAQFSRFARYRYAQVDRREDGYRVTLSDFRFQAERRNAFVCTIDLDRDLRVSGESFSF